MGITKVNDPNPDNDNNNNEKPEAFWYISADEFDNSMNALRELANASRQKSEEAK